MSISPFRVTLASLLSLTLVAAALLPLAAVADDEDGQDGDEGRRDPDRRARDEARRERDDDEKGGDHNRSHGDHEDKDERDVRVHGQHDGLDIDLSRRTATQHDRVHMGFQYDNARFFIQFKGRENDTKTQMKLDVRFGHVVEFRDTDGDRAYDRGEPIVSAWSLGDEGDNDVGQADRAQWQEPRIEEVVVDGQPGQKITAVARLGDSGAFELRFYVFGDFVSLGNSTLRPTGAKIDIEIRDYPYEANDTLPAVFLDTRAKSKFKWDHDHGEMGDDEDGVATTEDVEGQPISLLFTWKEFATVDGNDTAVRSTLLRSHEEASTDEDHSQFERREFFVLAYARGDHIVHDPEAFVSIQSLFIALPIGSPLLVAAGAATAAILVVSTLGPRMRRLR